jgi:hypothetical protein
MGRRLLTFNCHEAYVHLLGKLGLDLDVIDGLPGRYCSQWDERMRPVPERARLCTIEAALGASNYEAAIAHNLTDLLALRDLDLPKILVLHVSLEARIREEPNGPSSAEVQAQVLAYLGAISATAVAVSELKARSWGMPCTVIRPGADPDEYQGFEGNLACALRVANQVSARPQRLDWRAHERIVEGHPLRLVGHNPELSGSAPAASWEALRECYRSHRAYVHTAARALDDGYNLAVVEAMLTGMPVVSLAGAESPVVDGVNGYLSDDPGVLNARLGQLLADPEHARALGRRARETALETFSLGAFVSGWHAALDIARSRWQRRRRAPEPLVTAAPRRGHLLVMKPSRAS